MREVVAFAQTAGVLVLALSCCGRTGLEDEIGECPPDGPPPPVEEPDDCVVPDKEGTALLEVEYQVRIGTADVFFLIDASASMGAEINEIVRRLRTVIIPGTEATIEDAWLGAAYFSDFPSDPSYEGELTPFGLLASVTADRDAFESALIRIPATVQTGSEPEAQVEALYQTATGEGVDPIVPPASCPTGGRGYPCFRAEAVPVVLLATDAPFHDGPDGTNGYVWSRWWDRHQYADAVDALRAIGARVIGLDSGSGPMEDAWHWDSSSGEDLRALAIDTGTVDGAGEPLVYHIGKDGAGLGEQVVTGIETLVAETPMDVTTRVEDEPGDEVDASGFVVAMRAVRAEPPEGVVEVRGDRFVGVRPGTRVVFEILLDVSAAPRVQEAREYRLRVVVLGEGATRLAERLVAVRVPGLSEPARCDDL